MFIDILARIQKPPNSTYVEIGCGFGFGVDVAVNAMRWQGRGMDPGNLAKLGKQMLGVDIQTSYFNSTTVPDHSCDVVMASEVLEHLADPVAFLRDVHRSLRPDGVLALTTPDVQAIHRPIEKHALRATLSVGSHLILQSQASLSASLRTAGFLHQVVKTNGWRITAFASGVPMKLRDDPDDRQFQVTSYLVARADARASLDDLYFGYSGRAFFEAVSGAQWSLAQAVWTKLDPSLQTRYGIAVDEIEVPPPDAWTTPFHELHSVMPFNLPAIMLARAYLRLNLGQSRGAIMDSSPTSLRCRKVKGRAIPESPGGLLLISLTDWTSIKSLTPSGSCLEVRRAFRSLTFGVWKPADDKNFGCCCRRSCRCVAWSCYAQNQHGRKIFS
ncbi:bifunctional 2-polyprenyl-6-hydroxyphenol methylase/3-demethylubiquinol 3-O-methyltransferase UbiG [Acidisoma sp. L85]|uniref:class I SAM-dependent methyltransferase n=1 Tax=Acidisoma sp. L85 TaxID=1641850 RepID=UPI00131C358A|nr:class I SAM-dependent methyltransferase [Acidisoma sp. L85]